MNGDEFWTQSNGQPQTHGDIMDAFKVKQTNLASSFRDQCLEENTTRSSFPGWLKFAVFATIIIVIVDKLPIL